MAKVFGGNNTYLDPTWLRKFNPQIVFKQQNRIPAPTDAPDRLLTLDFTDANRDYIDTANPDFSQFLFYSTNPLAIYDPHNVSTKMLQDLEIKILGFVRYTDIEQWTLATPLDTGDTVQIQPDSFMNFDDFEESIKANEIYELWYQEGKGFEVLASEFGTLENKNFFIRIATVAVSEIELTETDLIETITFTILENYNELYLRR